MIDARFSIENPLKVGLVGTGYAAKRRAEAIQEDPRAQLLMVNGNTPENVEDFCQTYSVASVKSPDDLINDDRIDLVIISNINRDHASIARKAIEAGKHVVVEFPLALNFKEAEDLVTLAKTKQKLLHVEHIELLGGLHQAVKEYLPRLGNVFFGRYTTITRRHPLNRPWTYNQNLAGFPFIAAVARINRFTNLFGEVDSVSCQSRFWELSENGDYNSTLCNAQIGMKNGIILDITYGKGDVFWQPCRTFELHGDHGSLIFDGDGGKLIQQEEEEIKLGSRRGLFTEDTKRVLDYLFENKPLYLNASESCYALKVGNAADKSAKIGKTVFLDDLTLYHE